MKRKRMIVKLKNRHHREMETEGIQDITADYEKYKNDGTVLDHLRTLGYNAVLSWINKVSNCATYYEQKFEKSSNWEKIFPGQNFRDRIIRENDFRGNVFQENAWEPLCPKLGPDWPKISFRRKLWTRYNSKTNFQEKSFWKLDFEISQFQSVIRKRILARSGLNIR